MFSKVKNTIFLSIISCSGIFSAEASSTPMEAVKIALHCLPLISRPLCENISPTGQTKKAWERTNIFLDKSYYTALATFGFIDEINKIRKKRKTDNLIQSLAPSAFLLGIDFLSSKANFSAGEILKLISPSPINTSMSNKLQAALSITGDEHHCVTFGRIAAKSIYKIYKTAKALNK